MVPRTQILVKERSAFSGRARSTSSIRLDLGDLVSEGLYVDCIRLLLLTLPPGDFKASTLIRLLRLLYIAINSLYSSIDPRHLEYLLLKVVRIST
jgi:hypothetical protein